MTAPTVAETWRTPLQLAARRAARQRRNARRHAFEVAGCAPPQPVLDAIDAELLAVRAHLQETAR